MVAHTGCHRHIRLPTKAYGRSMRCPACRLLRRYHISVVCRHAIGVVITLYTFNVILCWWLGACYAIRASWRNKILPRLFGALRLGDCRGRHWLDGCCWLLVDNEVNNIITATAATMTNGDAQYHGDTASVVALLVVVMAETLSAIDD